MQKSLKRSVNGILLFDKAVGKTSNTALQLVKRLYAAEKAGHSGTLDPLASGMLPICFGEATKFASYLLDADKHYQVVAKLGIKTDTGDAEGKAVKERLVGTLSSKELEEVLVRFRGEITQIPPMFSALKHQGQPLYRLARRGIEIEREARTLFIYRLEPLDFEGNNLTLHVHCSKGTYIRSLVDDIGEALGCGAHVTELRRLAVGPYQTKHMIDFNQLEALFNQHGFPEIDRQLLPIDVLVQDLPEVKLTELTARYIQQGQAVLIPQAPTHGSVRLTLQGDFLGVGEILEDGRVAPKRLVQIGKN